jgi:flagellin-like hook-associated protein FlgL
LLTINKIDNPDPVPAGGMLTYNITVENIGTDTTATQMGLAGSGEQARLFGSLEAMEQALLADDRDGIEAALFELERVMENVVRIQGIVASRARRVDIGQTLLDRYQVTAQTRLADVQSTDMAEAITKLSEAQTLYQTALGTAASVFELNLFKYVYR